MDIRQFMFAGNARFTLENKAKGTHLTYRVRSLENKPGVSFVSVLNGPDNENSYAFIGTIFDGKTYRPSPKSFASPEAPCQKAFSWFFNLLTSGASLPPALHVHHEGRCGRCGRTLTTPESVTSGFGPDCLQIMGMAS